MPTYSSKRTNEQWLTDLRNNGQAREVALADLSHILLTGLPYALREWLSPADPNFSPLVEEVTQEALLKILDSLDTFEGRSQFTTWAHKIAVYLALTELRRKRWQDASLDELLENAPAGSPVLMADTTPGPETATERADLMSRLQQIINEDLTEKQRTALIEISVKGREIGQVAQDLGMKPNAVYKLLHDARSRLKNRMTAYEL